MVKIVSLFGSSAPQPGSQDFAEAHTVGRLLAEAGFAVAYIQQHAALSLA